MNLFLKAFGIFVVVFVAKEVVFFLTKLRLPPLLVWLALLVLFGLLVKEDSDEVSLGLTFLTAFKLFSTELVNLMFLVSLVLNLKVLAVEVDIDLEDWIDSEDKDELSLKLDLDFEKNFKIKLTYANS